MNTWLTIVGYLPWVSTSVLVVCTYLIVIFQMQTSLHLRAVQRFQKSSECYLRHDFPGGERCRREGQALAERADRLNRFLPPLLRGDR